MSTILIRPEAAVLDSGIRVAPVLRIGNGILQEICDQPPTGESIEELAGTLLPGMIDLQVNGAGGRGVDEATAEALDQVAAQVFAGGAAAFLPTLITTEFSRLLEQIAAVAGWIESGPRASAVPLGIHVEGPFLELAGAHDESCLLDPSAERVDAILDAGRGQIRLLTLAPGLNGAPEAVARLRKAGVTVSLGHGRFSDQFAACIEAGASMATHLFNAMGDFDHREPGLAGMALDEPRLSCSLIADGHHVHPAVLRNAYKILGADKFILVSDSVSAAGMEDGEYRLAGSPIWLKDGAVRNASDGLAGSALSMAEAGENFLRWLPELGPYTLASVASANAARVIDAQNWGSIAVGNCSSYALLSPEGKLLCLRY